MCGNLKSDEETNEETNEETDKGILIVSPPPPPPPPNFVTKKVNYNYTQYLYHIISQNLIFTCLKHSSL